MIQLLNTPQFDKWFEGLRDERAQARIQTRLNRLRNGNPGVVEPISEGVHELKIDYGPGYRVYFCQRGNILIVILAGGDKKTQKKDIQVALEIARNL